MNPSPLLFQGHKFDLRVYVLVIGNDPLRVYLFKDGLVRLATEEFSSVDTSNKDALMQHLTNFSINKHNPNYKNADESKLPKSKFEHHSGHKFSISYFFAQLKSQGVDIVRVWRDIEDIVRKTLCAVEPVLKMGAKLHTQDPFNMKHFEILGFDVLLDNQHKAYLLEVNHNPSLRVSSDVDLKVKSRLVYDTIKMVQFGLKSNSKVKTTILKKIKISERNIFGKDRRVKIKNLGKDDSVKAKDKYLRANCGMFVSIYPPSDQQQEIQCRKFILEAEIISKISLGLHSGGGAYCFRLMKGFQAFPSLSISKSELDRSTPTQSNLVKKFNLVLKKDINNFVKKLAEISSKKKKPTPIRLSPSKQRKVSERLSNSRQFRLGRIKYSLNTLHSNTNM